MSDTQQICNAFVVISAIVIPGNFEKKNVIFPFSLIQSGQPLPPHNTRILVSSLQNQLYSEWTEPKLNNESKWARLYLPDSIKLSANLGLLINFLVYRKWKREPGNRNAFW